MTPEETHGGQGERGQHEHGQDEHHEPGRDQRDRHESGQHEPGQHEQHEQHEPGRDQRDRHEPGRHEPGRHEPGRHEPGRHEPHTHRSDAAAAARAQHEATAIGWVAGTPIPRERLDARVRELRGGRLAARLPAVGSKEDRQFVRWTAQVLLTEELCRVELARVQGEPTRPDVAASPRTLTQAESLHLGSINAAAWSATPAISALYHLVTEPTPVATPTPATRTWYRITHTVAPSAFEAATAPDVSLGWTTLDDLPATLAAELRARPPGARVGPVRTGLGWHFATVTATEVRPTEPVRPADATDPTRLAAFNRWLDQRRQALVTNSPGFEHPGDPSQPDNTHRH